MSRRFASWQPVCVRQDVCISSAVSTWVHIWQQRKLIVLEAAAAKIANDVRQPLTSIVMRSAAAKQFLEQSPPDLVAVKLMLDEIVGASFRASEVFESNHVLFGADPVNKED